MARYGARSPIDVWQYWPPCWRTRNRWDLDTAEVRGYVDLLSGDESGARAGPTVLELRTEIAGFKAVDDSDKLAACFDAALAGVLLDRADLRDLAEQLFRPLEAMVFTAEHPATIQRATIALLRPADRDA